MKRTSNRFWKIYFSVIAVFLCILAVALCVLWAALNDYEQSRPRTVVENVFQTYIVTGDFKGLFEETNVQFQFEDGNKVAEHLKSLCNGEMSYYKTTANDGVEKYAVKSGDEKILTLTVEKSAENTKFGFQKYKFTQTNPEGGSLINAKIKVPEGYTVQINGKKVADSYISQKGLESESCTYMPENVRGVYYDVYSVEALLPDPQIKVFCGEAETVVEYLAETKEYVAKPLNDEALEEKISDYAVSAVKAYASYIQEDGTLQEVRNYFDTASDVYKKIQSNQMWVLDHNGCYFREIETKEFYTYNENIVSCRVKMEQVLRGINKQDYVDYIDVTIYLKKNANGKYMIYEMQNHK